MADRPAAASLLTARWQQQRRNINTSAPTTEQTKMTATNTTTNTSAAHAHPAINWFEIPVADLDRAQAFYQALLQAPLRREPAGPQTLAVLPYAKPAIGGALLAGPSAQPGPGGTLVYLNVGPTLDAALARALAAGATLLQPRVDLPDGRGAFVQVRDSEGNRIGLHAAQ